MDDKSKNWSTTPNKKLAVIVYGLITLFLIVSILFVTDVFSGPSYVPTYTTTNTTTASSTSSSKTDLKTYHLADAQFQIPKSWEPTGNEGSNYELFTSSDLPLWNMAIWQFQDESEYNSEKSPSRASTSGNTVNRTTEQISGVKVQKEVWTDIDEGPVAITYFFTKNGKYFRVNFNLEHGDKTSREVYLENDSPEIDNVINIIVSSMA